MAGNVDMCNRSHRAGSPRLQYMHTPACVLKTTPIKVLYYTRSFIGASDCTALLYQSSLFHHLIEWFLGWTAKADVIPKSSAPKQQTNLQHTYT